MQSVTMHHASQNSARHNLSPHSVNNLKCHCSLSPLCAATGVSSQTDNGPQGSFYDDHVKKKKKRITRRCYYVVTPAFSVIHSCEVQDEYRKSRSHFSTSELVQKQHLIRSVAPVKYENGPTIG